MFEDEESLPHIDQELSENNSQLRDLGDNNDIATAHSDNLELPKESRDNHITHNNFNFHIPNKLSEYFKHDKIPKPKEKKGRDKIIHDIEQPHTVGEVEQEILTPGVPASDETNQRYHFGFNFNRTNTLMDDAQINLNNLKFTVGERIRKVIYSVEDTVGPFVKKIIPNFVIAHYVYILFWVIIGSIIIYPAKDMEYIDALLYSTGSSTQGGLASTQLNDMKLYQQITIYIICMFTTPIFIHSSLTFLRLYWYEKRFDNIKQKSIQQYKMRRTKTIANLRTETMRAKTMTNTMTNTSTNRFKGYDSHNASEGLASRMKRFENNMRRKTSSATEINGSHHDNNNRQTLSDQNTDFNKG